MENNEITINGVPLASMGTTLLSGAYKELLTPPALKDFVENNDPLKNGTDVIVPGTDGEDDTSTPKLKERDVTLTFLIQGDSDSSFFDNYNAFVAMLNKGIINLSIPELNRNFGLIYRNSTQFANYMLNACKLAVKFREPNPSSSFDGLIWPPSGEYWDNDLDELIKDFLQHKEDFEQHKKDNEDNIQQINEGLETLSEEDERQQEEINSTLSDIEKIRELIKTDSTLDDAKAEMMALGKNYLSLYALASTVKTFIETTDTKDTTINTWREIEDFLQGITDQETLTGLIEQEHQKLKADFTEALNTLNGKKVGSTTIKSIAGPMTTTEYSALTPDANTLYIII